MDKPIYEIPVDTYDTDQTFAFLDAKADTFGASAPPVSSFAPTSQATQWPIFDSVIAPPADAPAPVAARNVYDIPVLDTPRPAASPAESSASFTSFPPPSAADAMPATIAFEPPVAAAAPPAVAAAPVAPPLKTVTAAVPAAGPVAAAAPVVTTAPVAAPLPVVAPPVVAPAAVVSPAASTTPIAAPMTAPTVALTTAPAAPAPVGAPTLAAPAAAAPAAPAAEPDRVAYTPPVARHVDPVRTPTGPVPTVAIATEEPEPDDEAPAAWEFDRSLLESADPDLITALNDVVAMRASDLHVTANAVPMVRVDGALMPASITTVWNTDKVRQALRSILSDSQKEIFDNELELDFAYTVSSNARFRVNFYQQRDAMGAAFRLIPTEIKQLKDLGVPETVARFAGMARGLVLVTGPTGSGKSTTLAALVDLVNRTRADHIMTVEDPIEFLHRNHRSVVNQREVGHDTHSFGAALKHVLRQDPDVILIGELRDLETISVALTAAETGHLVFATLHTQDAAQTIDRVIDVFPPHQQGQVRTQLAATLQGVVCQTLVKRANGRGRVVATEVLIATPAIGNLIREGKTYQIASAMQAGGDLGMHTMDRHLADLTNAGVITQQAATDKAQDVEGLKKMIHRVETPSEIASKAIAASSIDFGDAYSQAVR